MPNILYLRETWYTYVRNTNSGEVHRFIYTPMGRYSLEECGADQINDSGEIDHDTAIGVPAEQRCGHCFKEGDDNAT